MITTKDLNFEKLFEGLPNQYLLVSSDAPAFTIIAASDAYLDTTEKIREEITGKSLFDVFPDKSPRALVTGKGQLTLSLEKCIKTKKHDSTGVFRYDIPLRDGSFDVRYWQADHHPILSYAGKVYAIMQTIEDVTEMVLSNEKLELAQLQLDEALSAGMIGSWVWDIKKDIVIADAGLARVFGITTREAQLGVSIDVLLNSIFEDDKERVGNDIEKALKKSNSYESEYRTIDHMGVIRWVIARGRIERDSKGEPVRFPGVLVDITERKEAEDRLLESEERLRFMADAMPQLVFSTDGTGMPDYYNEQWFRYTGVKSRQTSDVDWYKLFHPDDQEMVFSAYGKSITTGSPLEVEFRLYNAPRDTFRWVIGRALPFKDDTGTIIKWYGTCTDIDEQKRLENELVGQKENLESRVIERTTQLEETNDGLHKEIIKREEVEAELQEYSKSLSQSNQELQDFAYVASHDLQEPLRKIQAFGNLLETEFSEQLGEGADYLHRMQNAASRMSILIQDLLSFSRVTTRAKPSQRVELDIVVPEVLIDLESRIEDTKAKIILKSLPEVMADPTHMRQLFQNLISNALKFHAEDRPPIIKIKSILSKNKKDHIIIVEDNGIGFDEKYLDRIFSVFQRLHGRETYEGTGIGLAVCRKIVERYDGTITAESKNEQGSTFIITLPVIK